MNATLVVIPTVAITNWDTFHDVFARTLGFPAFYGRNMNAWIDCMTCADDASAQMIAKAVRPGELLVLQLEDAADFATRCPDQLKELIECSAFVNYRRTESGGVPLLSLLLSGDFS